VAVTALFALASLSVGYTMGWLTRGVFVSGRAHREVELAGCPHCRLIYVSPKRNVCPECGATLHFQYVLSGDRIDAK
jgi:hypothetical protein